MLKEALLNYLSKSELVFDIFLVFVLAAVMQEIVLFCCPSFEGKEVEDKYEDYRIHGNENTVFFGNMSHEGSRSNSNNWSEDSWRNIKKDREIYGNAGINNHCVKGILFVIQYEHWEGHKVEEKKISWNHLNC